MGRFFQQDKPEFIDDNMFNLPYQLMGEVLMNKEKAVDDTIADAVKFYDKLSADVLQQDNPRAREIIQGYEQQINDIVAGIQDNPIEYNKYTSTIRDLGRTINKDWNMGEIGTMQQYKKNVLTEYDKLDKHLKENPQDAEYVAKEKAAILAKYQGINWNKELMKPGASPDIQESYFALDFNLDDYLKNKMEADGYSKEWDTHSGGYIYRHKQTGETLSEEKAALAAKSYFDANPQIQKAVERRGVLGMQDFINADLENSLSKDEKGNLIYGDDYYAKNIKSAALHRTFKNTSTSNTMHTDEPYWKQQQRAWDLADKEAEKEQEIGLTQESLYSHNLYNSDSIGSDIGKINYSLYNSNKELLNMAQLYVEAGGKENDAIYKAALKGDKNALIHIATVTKTPQETLERLADDYKALNIKRKILNQTTKSFQEDLIKNGNRNLATLVNKRDWYKNPKLKEEYDKFVTKKGIYNNPFVSKTKEVSFRGFDIDGTTKEALISKTEENILNLQFTPQNTVTGQQSEYELPNGDKVIFINKNSTIKAGNYKQNGKNVTYLKVDKYSMQDLRDRGLVDIEKTINPDTQEVETKIITMKKGKPVEFKMNKTSFGVVHGLDNNGKNNFGIKLQSGNNYMDAELPMDQYRLPKKFEMSIKKNNDYWKDDNLQSFDWRTYHRDEVKIPGTKGAKYIIDGDKVYFNGVEIKAGSPKNDFHIRLARKLSLENYDNIPFKK